MVATACFAERLRMRRMVLCVWPAVGLFVVLGLFWSFHGRLPTTADLLSRPNDVAAAAPEDGLSACEAATSPPSSSPLEGAQAAVMVETRMLDNLVPLLLHFSSILGPSWPVILFTKRGVWCEPPSAGPLRRAIDDGRVRVHYLPPGPLSDISNFELVSVFWTRPWIWEQLAGFGRVLTFQTDSVLCSKANTTADDFLAWDYIGAPVASALGRGYNGGLSIRNPAKFLAAVNENDFDADLARGKAGEGGADMMVEDQWFYAKLLRMPGARMPEQSVAKKFSVESVWDDAPLAYHQPRRWHADRMDEIRRYCPEVDMIYK